MSEKTPPAPFVPETVSGRIASASSEENGTWTVYSWDGEPIDCDLTREQALAKLERVEAKNENWTPQEWDDDE